MAITIKLFPMSCGSEFALLVPQLKSSLLPNASVKSIWLWSTWLSIESLLNLVQETKYVFQMESYI